MSEDSQQPVLPEADNEDNYEYKPVVKYTALGLAIAAVLGMGYATFRMGYAQGRDEAVTSQKVSQRLNEAAVRNLTYFLQCSSLDDAELEALATEADTRLDWIADDRVRREAEWMLVQTLTERGMREPAAALLTKLYADAPKDAVWARRAAQAGQSFLNLGEPAAAAAWFRRAADAMTALGMNSELVDALTQLYAAQNLRGEGDTAAFVEKLLDEIKGLPAEDASDLRLILLVHLGELDQDRGDAAKAKEYFDAAIRSADAPEKRSPEEKVALATALFSAEGASAAQEVCALLEQALSELGQSPADRLNRIQALRIRSEALMLLRNEPQNAIGFLNQALGVADTLSPSRSRHSCRAYLMEQRGWLQLMMQDYQAALDSFIEAQENSADVTVAMQAREGEGRALLALNKPKEAEGTLQGCLKLRKMHTPKDVAAIGRVRLLIAQTLDHQNRLKEVAPAYEAAAELLRQAGETERANLLTALLGQGYALIQLKDWRAAGAVWQQVQDMVKDIPDRREEARKMLAICRAHDKDAAPAPAEAGDPQAAAEAAAADAAVEGEEAAEELDSPDEPQE